MVADTENFVVKTGVPKRPSLAVAAGKIPHFPIPIFLLAPYEGSQPANPSLC